MLVDREVLLATDTGPANGPLDSFLEQRGCGLDFGGSVSEAVRFQWVVATLCAFIAPRPLARSGKWAVIRTG